MTSRTVMAVCAVVALGGCGGDDDAAQEASIAISHTTKSDTGYGDTLYGDAATVRVRTRGAPVDEVRLEASPYPFRGYEPVASAKPAPDGLVEFKVKPERNTRYRAVAGGARSGAELVVVSLPGRFSSARTPHGGIQVFLTVTGPPGLEARNGSKVFFYLRRRGSRTFRLIGTREPYVLRSNAIRAGGNFDVPPKRGDRFFICPGEGGMAVGIGFEKSPVPNCGDRTFLE
jgi:hypothetical protein